MNGPLEGIVIIDLSKVLAGPYCTMVLADLGARVIKIEPPEKGDDSRCFPPFINGVSAYFASINRGKESIALNLKDDKDRAIFEKLLKKADVVVENFRPNVMERLGYGWNELHKRFPRLIYGAASGFGNSGPYSPKAAYDMVVQGMGGLMSITGHKGGPPTRVGTSIGDITAALFLTIGLTSALYRRSITGKGMKIDIAMLDCQVSILENAIARHFATGEIPEPLGARHPSIAPFEAYNTEDGYIIIAAGNDNLFEKLTEAIKRSDIGKDPAFRENKLRVDNVELLKVKMEETLKTKKTSEWLIIIDEAGVPCAPINNIKDVMLDPQVKARNMIIETHDPVAGIMKMAGNPIKISDYLDKIERKSAPGLDQDRKKILEEVNGKS